MSCTTAPEETLTVSYRVESETDSVLVEYLDADDMFVRQAVVTPWEVSMEKRLGTLAQLTAYKMEPEGSLAIVIIIDGYDYWRHTSESWGWLELSLVVEGR